MNVENSITITDTCMAQKYVFCSVHWMNGVIKLVKKIEFKCVCQIN
uniref:Uncharacterized protein n=1 Tax=Anguilla anguilla TaxID=7936 RepID=A0A0E9WTU8_ANGAN